MKIHKIEINENDNVRILIKKGESLIAICIDEDNNIMADSYENGLEILNEIAGLQTYMQKLEKDFFNGNEKFQDMDFLQFMKDEEE